MQASIKEYTYSANFFQFLQGNWNKLTVLQTYKLHVYSICLKKFKNQTKPIEHKTDCLTIHFGREKKTIPHDGSASQRTNT